MRTFTLVLLSLGLGAAATLAGAGEAPAPAVKVLESPADPTQSTILIGRTLAGDMIIQFELEPAKAMWMQMGNPAMWMEQPVGSGELYHVEVKPIDPKSQTRISYAAVRFDAVNGGSGERVALDLHPMWGGSGLHYAANSALAGDGTYDATITVEAPTFARDLKSRDLWSKPAVARFHFKLAGGKLAEVSEPAVN